MLEQATSFPKPNEDTRHLPALLPPVSLVLQRTQLAIGLLRDVVKESSSTYWYEKGKRASAAQRWDEAISCYDKCLQNNKKGTQYLKLAHDAAGGLCEVYANRGEYRAREGDTEGSMDDEHDFHVVNEYLEEIIGQIESYLD